MTKGKDPRYEKARAEARADRDRKEAIWRFHDQVTELRSDRLFTPDEAQAVYDEALKVMTYPPGTKPDGDLARATDTEITRAEELIFKTRFDKEQAWIRAEQERAAWEVMHLGPSGDYVKLTGGRVVKKTEYDPEKHGPKEN